MITTIGRIAERHIVYRIQPLKGYFQDFQDLQQLSLNGEFVVVTSHPTKSLRYYSGRTGIPPEAAVLWPGFYDRITANAVIDYFVLH